MASPPEKDLFHESTMTFGQHLEELRTCLFKSVLGLVVGVILGLMVGSYVVSFIQRPLSRALAKYYQKESVDRVQDELKKLKESGKALPYTDQDVEDRVIKKRLFADEIYIDPAEMFQELKSAYPVQFKDVAVPKTSSEESKFIRLFLWHHSEDDSRVRIKSLNAQEAFTVYVKGSLLVGVLLSSPWIFYQIWHFVAAGLYPHERHYVHLYLPFSMGLFFAGAALAFFVVFEPVLNFLLRSIAAWASIPTRVSTSG
jgi:sec-independent protein translocase protein TatC